MSFNTVHVVGHRYFWSSTLAVGKTTVLNDTHIAPSLLINRYYAGQPKMFGEVTLSDPLDGDFPELPDDDDDLKIIGESQTELSRIECTKYQLTL